MSERLPHERPDGWYADWANDPERDFALVLELTHERTTSIRVRRSASAELIVEIFFPSEIREIPALFLAELIEAGEAELPPPSSDWPPDSVGKWTADLSNTELSCDGTPMTSIRRTNSGELILEVLPHRTTFNVPAVWLAGIITRAEKERSLSS